MENCESKQKKGVLGSFSVLLELCATDDLVGFKIAVEEEGHDIDEPSCWYGRRIGSNKMGFEERTPLMIAAMFGSKQILSYVLETGAVDVNRACGLDGATALHCAVAGGSASSPDVVKLLLNASADTNSLDANGNRPGDLMVPYLNSSFNLRRIECLLTGSSNIGEECVLPDHAIKPMEEQVDQQILIPATSKDGSEKKEYPADISLPDIKNGIYGTDEFRMYTFKVQPCSRAYSHNWTECPFVHPGENARRRDPRKYHYSCVPCPEFRKGTCRLGDACEYAHGIFECWLHPAQYRTRLCKDETGCTRRVCFFAHKTEELRPLYASTGSGLPSPTSFSNGASSLDMTSISPITLGSPSHLVPPASTPPMTPLGASPMNGSMWQNHPNIGPPALQLSRSRLKTASSARDMDLDAKLLGLESYRRRQQQLMDEISSLSSPTSWNNTLAPASAFAASSVDQSGDVNRLRGVKPTKLDDIYGSLDDAILSQLQGSFLNNSASQVQSPTGMQIRQNINQHIRSSYPASLSSSPVRSFPSFGIDPSGAASAAVLNSRAAAFAKRSQSFIDRSTVNRLSGLSSPASSANVMPSTRSDWGSADGKLDWAIQKEELNKLRKSASFGLRSSSSSSTTPTASMLATGDDPDVSWGQSLAKNAPSVEHGHFGFEEQHRQHHLNIGGSEMLPSWVEQLYMEQEQIVA
ncbi:Zinc finger CCCH domain-containing protein [Actinidia chinensis var. chinensis]|uniref:Zinc finger CCCH domain-containing protein n=1 Tax=Actinidia chinensis var. chinensis TaxID=1590841 RepID=A0A2R6QJB3_ACTCC|nr:Zinc finger CCCH domain-containing protein [Actinidia chinensis var. chinensis]